jgi:hypothetical protein
LKRKSGWTAGRFLPKAGRVPVLLCILGACAASAAQAQERSTADGAISVQKRARPDLDPSPLRFGGFEALVFLETRLTYDDNIYASRKDVVDDALAAIAGDVSARSTWSRHALAFDASAALTRGVSQDDENTRTYEARASGRLDWGAGSQVTAQAGYARAYEPRGSIGDVDRRGPRTAYDTVNLELAASHATGRLTLEAEAGMDRYVYGRHPGRDEAISAARDYHTWNIGLRVGYAAAPGILAFAEGTYNEARYPDDLARLDRSSDGWSLRGGVGFGLSRLIRGRAAIGYQDQSFADPVFPRIRGLDFSAEIEWSPTRLTTWSIEARRSIQRSPLVSIAGIRQSRYGARVDHEALRNLLVWARVDYTTSEYSGSVRAQNDLAGGLGGDWLLSRRVKLSLASNVQRTRSHGAPALPDLARAFDRSRTTVSLRYAL